MSRVHVHVEDAGVPDIRVIAGNNAAARSASLIHGQALCVRDQCALWRVRGAGGGCCGLENSTVLTEIAVTLQRLVVQSDDMATSLCGIRTSAAHLKNLEPPTTGPSPMMRLAQAIEKLVDLTASRMERKADG